jgi:hypothetical protein
MTAQQLNRYRSPSSVSFWAAMMAGSVIVHLLLWVYLQPLFTAERSPSRTAAFTPIEWVELDYPSGSTAVPSDRFTALPPQSATPAAPSSPNVSPSANLNTDRTRTPAESTQAAAPTETDLEIETTELNTAADAVTEPEPEPELELEPEQSAAALPPIASPTESLPPVPTVPTVATEPTAELPPESGEDDPDLPIAETDPNPEPQRYRISVSRVEERPVTVEGDRRDAYDEPPALRRYADYYLDDPLDSDCTITPDVQRSLGESVSLRVLINREGDAIAVTPVDDYRVSQAYLELAQCIVQTWDFEPAYTAGQPVDSDALIVELDIGQLVDGQNR